MRRLAAALATADALVTLGALAALALGRLPRDVGTVLAAAGAAVVIVAALAIGAGIILAVVATRPQLDPPYLPTRNL